MLKNEKLNNVCLMTSYCFDLFCIIYESLGIIVKSIQFNLFKDLFYKQYCCQKTSSMLNKNSEKNIYQKVIERL